MSRLAPAANGVVGLPAVPIWTQGYTGVNVPLSLDLNFDPRVARAVAINNATRHTYLIRTDPSGPIVASSQPYTYRQLILPNMLRIAIESIDALASIAADNFDMQVFDVPITPMASTATNVVTVVAGAAINGYMFNNNVGGVETAVGFDAASIAARMGSKDGDIVTLGALADAAALTGAGSVEAYLRRIRDAQSGGTLTDGSQVVTGAYVKLNAGISLPCTAVEVVNDPASDGTILVGGAAATIPVPIGKPQTFNINDVAKIYVKRGSATVATADWVAVGP